MPKWDFLKKNKTALKYYSEYILYLETNTVIKSYLSRSFLNVLRGRSPDGSLCVMVLQHLVPHSTTGQSKCCFRMHGNCWVTAWPSDWSPEASTESAVRAQVKAIQLCDRKGWSLAAPLLDRPPFKGWLPLGRDSGDPSFWSFLLWAYDTGEHFIYFFDCLFPLWQTFCSAR